ncbi:MAG: dihydrofolate reductase [Saprospiraceae bacterium]|nr:dihydrofolate reductase family protein [Bacteroidia bacterium]NNL92861.1 dihydrofolate reductase [Saprospiraceae bacterium]
MKKRNPKVTIHMVSSLDGFIAKKDDTVDWLKSVDTYENGITLTAEEIDLYVKNIDCYVMGSKTYETALRLGWPYGNKPVFVISHRDLASEKDSVSFYNGDLSKLINQILKPKYENIWVVGGAVLTKQIINLKLADILIRSIMPIIIGEGTLFFDFIGEEYKLHLQDVKAYNDGMVELTYTFKHD